MKAGTEIRSLSPGLFGVLQIAKSASPCIHPLLPCRGSGRGRVLTSITSQLEIEMSTDTLPTEPEWLVTSRKAAYCACRRLELDPADLTTQDMEELIHLRPRLNLSQEASPFLGLVSFFVVHYLTMHHAVTNLRPLPAHTRM
jgi:hypothetical protein